MSHLRQALFLGLLILGITTNCSDDASAPKPSNLQINVIMGAAGTGQITVQATAENAKYYKILFGEDPFAAAVQVTDGVANYTYSAGGNYSIVVQAHQNESLLIVGSKEIEIDLPIQVPTEGFVSATSYDGMNLVWQDEFNGTELNTAVWTHEIGTGSSGWGNNELQYYRSQNTKVENGNLIITAKKESFAGSSYTSSRIITKGNKFFKYGRVDIRAALPEGQGIWPALWMLGENISTVGWPKCGEIDIMEMVGGNNRENTVHGTVHWDNNNSHAQYGGDYTLSTGTFNDKFHVFSIVWDESRIFWYVDGIEYHVIDTTPEGLNEFRENFFFIFNVAVGGNWPGSPNNTTRFPQHLIVDYVRVFQKI